MKKYKKGNQIRSIADFEKSKNSWFMVEFGDGNLRPKHRSFLISWQYRTLQNFILRGQVYEADKEAA